MALLDGPRLQSSPSLFDWRDVQPLGQSATKAGARSSFPGSVGSQFMTPAQQRERERLPLDTLKDIANAAWALPMRYSFLTDQMARHLSFGLN